MSSYWNSSPSAPGPGSRPAAPKRLERSRTDKFLGGVCGGVAHYLNTDPTLIRVLWVVLTLVLGGAPLIVYLVMLFVVPEEGTAPPPPPVYGPMDQGYPGAVGHPLHQPNVDRPAPHPSPGPSPRPPQPTHPHPTNTRDDQLWDEGGAPWEQPARSTWSASGHADPMSDETTESAPQVGQDDSAPSANPSPGAPDRDASDYDAVADAASAGRSDADADTGPSQGGAELDPPDRNDPSRGQQPIS